MDPLELDLISYNGSTLVIEYFHTKHVGTYTCIRYLHTKHVATYTCIRYFINQSIKYLMIH